MLATSNSFADCSINYIGSDDLKHLIKERKFEFDSYDKLCKKLKDNNAGVSFTSITQISPYQTTASVSLALYPLGDKYKGITIGSDDWIGYEEERTSKAEKDRLYSLAMYALEQLANKPEKLNSLLTEVREMRAATK